MVRRLPSKIIYLLSGIVLFTIIYFHGSGSFQASGIALVSLVVFWWITQPIPLYVTALIPIILGPAFGLLPKADIASAYGNQMIFLFLGGFMIALAIEKWKLHELISIRLIRFIGQSPTRILIGFMLSTAFISMWISNTATTLMMLPMALSVIHSLEGDGKKRFSLGILLGIAYAANIGGTATIIGTPPNVQLASILEEQFGITITFLGWLKIGLPFALLSLILAFLLIWLLLFRRLSLKVKKIKSQNLDKPQIIVLLIFLIVVLLWIFSKPLGLPFSDTAIALMGGSAMFAIQGVKNKSILEWKDMQRIPWGILLLFGGGLAIAKILENTGTIVEIVNYLGELNILSQTAIIFIFVVLAIFATELMSNLALVSLLIPIVGVFAQEFNLPIITLCASVALSASCAFMFPVATPPNAIVYSSGFISFNRMMVIGFAMNLITIGLISILMLA